MAILLNVVSILVLLLILVTILLCFPNASITCRVLWRVGEYCLGIVLLSCPFSALLILSTCSIINSICTVKHDSTSNNVYIIFCWLNKSYFYSFASYNICLMGSSPLYPVTAPQSISYFKFELLTCYSPLMCSNF